MKKYAFLISTLLLWSPVLMAQETFPVNGVHDEKHLEYAFINARIFTDYKTVIDKGVLIIKDGVVQAAGKEVSIPKGAVVIDLSGKTIYPGLIDIFSDYGMPESKKGQGNGFPQFLSNTKGAYNWNQAIRAEVNAGDLFSADQKKAEELRKLGFGMVNTFIRDGVVRGSSAVVALADEKENKLIISRRAADMHSFEKGSSTQDYPSSLMGSIALLRQTYLDAQWYAGSKSVKETNISLDAFNKNLELPGIFEVLDKYSIIRADKVGDEFSRQYIIKTAGDEYQRIAEVKNTGASLILPLNFPQPFDLDDPYDAMQVTLAELKHWENAPSNPAVVEKAGIPFCLTSYDLKDKKDFWKNIRKAIAAGLSEEQALKALTQQPAEMLHIADKAGALKPGMVANFLITSGNLFDKKTLLLQNWVQGSQYVLADMNEPDLRGKYELKSGNLSVKFTIDGDINELKAEVTDSSKLKLKLNYNYPLISLVLENSSDGSPAARFSGTTDGKNMKGRVLGSDGSWASWEAHQLSAGFTTKADTAKKPDIHPGSVWYPNKEFGWKELPSQKDILIRNVTAWTNEKDGIIKNASVLIQNGKIAGLYKEGDSTLHAGSAQVIEGKVMHLTPGIIDEHSHIAIARGVNEGTQAVTSEVRIGDVLEGDDIDMYRQVSGGVVASQLLHGSANPVGGQSAIIKLRWGQAPEKFKIDGADGFIKFALGENVKQSNWGDRQVIRFPQTRMGVEQVYMDAFTRAKEYEESWKKFKGSSLSELKGQAFPRKDLELEALVEILNKKRFITCHSYVQSEINMLMHVADSMGFQVNTFTHILEGYKVADKMKARSIGGSTFADWWAYKYEVIEAIPYNAAIMSQMGIVTAVNSDDAEMGRRLNQEAAKAIKYGGLSEEEALKLCTLNPAKLLHLDNRMGSLKVGKDADLVLWTDNPLSVYARVDKTFIDGIPYFDSIRDQEMRQEIVKERARLVKKMAEARKNGENAQKPLKSNNMSYHCEN